MRNNMYIVIERALIILFLSSHISLAVAASNDTLRIGKLNSQSSLNTISHTQKLRIIGTGPKNTEVSLQTRGNLNKRYKVLTDGRGRYQRVIPLAPGMNTIAIRSAANSKRSVKVSIAYMPMQFVRSFQGSTTAGLEPFDRLFPDSIAYSQTLAPRSSATELSATMAEREGAERFSKRISLGMVFFGQFVDHDLDRIQSKGQGPSSNPVNPINIRTPALDLDSVYGAGLEGSKEFYHQDQLHFQLGRGGSDLLRDASGKALIGDDRNDENGFIAAVHLAFQRYHNHLVDQMLHGIDPLSLSLEQRSMLFHGVRNLLTARYQGMVANQLSIAFSRLATPDNLPSLKNVPIEFAGAVYRLGHTLIPQRVKIDQSGATFSPVDPKLRGDAAAIDLKVLFGSNAQPAAEFDSKISQVMRELLIPLSPTDPSQGDMVGGQAPNIGSGRIIDGVLHLDLIETNLLRGRELKLASGEECFARIFNLPYQPSVHGNSDLFAYVLQESNSLGYLGPVGSFVFSRTIGGILSSDPYRYFNGDIYTAQEISDFRNFTLEKMLSDLGAI